jgi:drug/metabolite transporter (DMT)-like permease
MGLGAATALPLAPGLGADLGAAPPSALLAVGFLALGASALGFLTWAYAVARVEVTAAASTLYAVPPVAALVGWIALGEVPSPLTAAGGAIALAGVALTSRSRSRGSRARPAPGRPTSPGARSRPAPPSATPAEEPAAGARAGRARPTPA